jgi:hypothetical protein
MIRLLLGTTLLLMIVGCTKTAEEPKAEPKPEKQSILKQKTQDIGEYDPDAGRELSDSKVRADDIILGALQAYGPTVEKVSKMAIDRQIQFFQIENERYPTYDEFMEQIIKRYNIRLPVLPGKHEYQYDVENHKLVVVKPVADEKE